MLPARRRVGAGVWPCGSAVADRGHLAALRLSLRLRGRWPPVSGLRPRGARRAAGSAGLVRWLPCFPSFLSSSLFPVTLPWPWPAPGIAALASSPGPCAALRAAACGRVPLPALALRPQCTGRRTQERRRQQSPELPQCPQNPSNKGL